MIIMLRLQDEDQTSDDTQPSSDDAQQAPQADEETAEGEGAVKEGTAEEKTEEENVEGGAEETSV